MTTSNQQRENRIARHRSSGSDVYAGYAVDVTGRSYQCKHQCYTMPHIKRRIRLAWACYDCFERGLYDMEDAQFMLMAPARDRGDGDPAGGLSAGSNSQNSERTPQPPPKHHRLPAPTAHRPPHVVRQGLSKRHNVRALRRPSTNDATSLREPYHGRAVSD